SVHLRWNQLQLQNAVGNLAVQRFTLGSAMGNGWAWEGRQPWLQLPSLKLQELQADGQRRQLELGMVSIHHGQVRLSIRKDGAIAALAELQSLLPARSSAAAASEAATASADTFGSPWNFLLHGAHAGL